MIHNYQPNSAQSRQEILSVHVNDNIVTVITKTSTKDYVCPTNHFALYYKRRIEKTFMNDNKS